MSADMPSWGFLTVMRSARRKLFKIGWSQEASGRLDCIEKTYGDIRVKTIGAGDKLLLNPGLPGMIDPEDSYVPLSHPVVKVAKKEIESVVEPIVKRNRKRFDREIKEYEAEHGIKFHRSERYGV